MPRKKSKKKLYFGEEQQNAIIEYNSNPENYTLRNKLYSETIHAAFDKLAENIINTFKFTYFDDGFNDVKHEVVAFMVMNIHKYDHTKGSKAFSYFSIVAKNYLILHNNNNYKKYKTHDDIKVLNRKPNDDISSDMDIFTDELIDLFEDRVPTLFKRKKDIDVAYAVIQLMRTREEIENFNKKALYILIREMTDVETSHITKVTNVLKKHYKKALEEFSRHGTITPISGSNANKFFVYEK
tara:strand:- start:2431 stop:3150 length:720 start_codon:yes stop_codon:yes gene_type:complete